MTIKKIKKYGWRRQLPDYRDHKFTVCHSAETLCSLPSAWDMRPQCPPVYDQGQLGSCTGNAIAGLVHFDQMRQKPQWAFSPSRLFIYYNERVVEGDVSQDAGAEIRDGIKSLNTQGVCREDLYPYDPSKFANKPSAAAYTNALLHRGVTYQSLNQDLITMKTCLAGGLPFVFGFTVYDSFESSQVAETGVLNMPLSSESVVGGHAVMCVGYNDVTRRFIVRNSWGSDWGQKGYFTIPYAYLVDNNLASDFWTISMLSN